MKSQRLINATCPDCRGPLTERQEGNIVEYECLVGHRYSPQALLHEHAQAQERALWSAIVALEEAGNLVTAVGPHVTSSVRSSLAREAEQKGQQAARIRQIVQELTPFRTE